MCGDSRVIGQYPLLLSRRTVAETNSSLATQTDTGTIGSWLLGSKAIPEKVASRSTNVNVGIAVENVGSPGGCIR